MKNISKKQNFSTFLFTCLTLVLVMSCIDKGDGWADDRYLENFELSWDNPNPKTGQPYTADELAELKYDPNEEERFKGATPVVLNLLTSKQISKVSVIDGSDGSTLLTITEAQPVDSKFKVSISTSLDELKIKEGKTKALKFNIVYNDGSIGSTLFKVVSILPLPPAVDILKGHWKFDDASNFLKATLGNDLTLGGNNGVSAVSGMSASDGAALTSFGGYLEVNHGLPASGGDKVNNYTIILDVSLPASSFGTYSNLLQTLTDNSSDGSTYISPAGGLWGNGIGTSGGGSITEDTWHRVVITVGDGDYRAYIDGGKILGGSPGADGIHSLDLSKFLLFADNGNNEDAPIKVTEVMLFDVTFDNNWITEDLPPVGQPLK
ncbi:hypothetical protein [Polaribacter cellanae]|uniref:Uncharacterized protein n=1 Tax=Polaribacter cellanae TaxID=2818493 RepID=A0A975H7P7_9FLAO|nr:hypothetical protein [Polaribacter cellanae]QTE23687.1 hypothetical protein J3359_05265 [Polaribacter cellanae]